MSTPTDLMALVDEYALAISAVRVSSRAEQLDAVGDARDAVLKAIQNLPCFLEGTEADDSSSSEQAARVESVCTPRPPAGPEPIEPSEIRAGDLIRWESDDELDRASEYRATGGEIPARGRHYLLDRPAPAVDLPTELTWGWMRIEGVEDVQFGRWSTDPDCVEERWRGLRYLHRRVTAFTPAVAVPKAALDELREYGDSLVGSDHATRDTRRIWDFLAAVDAANAGDPS